DISWRASFFIIFKTLNTRDPENLQQDKQGGVGLLNISKRLELKYDKPDLNFNITNTHFDLFLKLELKMMKKDALHDISPITHHL
ncbi:MAG: hypothetical protein AAFO07_30080, partial [Bacteroidota bacterium]